MLRKLIGTTKAGEPDERTREWKMHLLTKADIFRDLSHAEMEEIERITTMTTCRKGRQFYAPGEYGEVLFILKKGRVQVSRISEEGRRLSMAILEPGAVFGEMPMLSQRMENSTAEALEDCTICIISRSDLENLLLTKPHVALNIIRTPRSSTTSSTDGPCS